MKKIKDKKIHTLREICMLSNLINCELVEEDYRCRNSVDKILDEKFPLPPVCPWGPELRWEDILKSIAENAEHRQLIQLLCASILEAQEQKNGDDPYGFDPYAVASLIAESLIVDGQLRSEVFVDFYRSHIYCHMRDQINKDRAKATFLESGFAVE